MRRHHAKVVLRTIEGVPWKWEARCTCGWIAQSWAWDRTRQGGYGPGETGGALPMALDHVGRAR
jgi:hypothetical protein